MSSIYTMILHIRIQEVPVDTSKAMAAIYNFDLNIEYGIDLNEPAQDDINTGIF